MRIEAGHRRRRRLSMTSLIDVIFLLLLFFMLSSTFTRFAEIDIAAGRAGQMADTAERPDVFIRIAGKGDWKVNGLRIRPENAVAELTRLVANGAKSAVVVVRKDVTSQELVEALERIAQVKRLAVSVAG